MYFGPSGPAPVHEDPRFPPIPLPAKAAALVMLAYQVDEEFSFVFESPYPM